VITPNQSEVIDRWVIEQMRQPWPLTSSQLQLIRRTLRPRSVVDAAHSSRPAILPTSDPEDSAA
jgi:hypothetical protein